MDQGLVPIGMVVSVLPSVAATLTFWLAGNEGIPKGPRTQITGL